jgi:hypothetical protein
VVLLSVCEDSENDLPLREYLIHHSAEPSGVSAIKGWQNRQLAELVGLA